MTRQEARDLAVNNQRSILIQNIRDKATLGYISFCTYLTEECKDYLLNLGYDVELHENSHGDKYHEINWGDKK